MTFHFADIEKIPFPVFWADKSMKIVYANQKACVHLGYSLDELTKLTIEDISLRFQPLKWEELTSTISEKGFHYFESRHITKNKTIIPVEIYVSRYDIDGKEYFCGMVVEISELSFTNSLSREGSLLLEAFLNYIDEPLGLIDNMMNVIYYNQNAKKLLGIENDDYIGKKCLTLINQENEIKKVFQSGKTEMVEQYLPEKDLWLDVLYHPIFGKNREVVKVAQHFRDITSRKKAEISLLDTLKELKRSEEEKRLSHFVIDNTHQAIFMLKKDGTFFRVNDYACEYWGYSRQELEQMKVWQINPTLNEKGWSKIWEQLNREKRLLLETIHQTSNGELRDVEISANILDFEGNTFSVGFVHDITEKKKSEKKLKDALAEIQSLKNKLEAENIYLQDEIKLEHNFEEIITQNAEMKKILTNVERVANTRTTVLILGETGTGKELIARAIHNISNRNKHPLVKVNCAALPASLIESELFGYEKGAFTGALYKKIGRFELADKGTIFLDEIGELPIELQPKLLRVLQDGEFERLGNPKTFKVDVRVIAATNRNLSEEVKKGNFRPDLFYRLNVFPISLPPLRQRKEDIPLLVNYFINKFSHKTGRKFSSVSHKTMAACQLYDWPGNIRELENVIERAMITSMGTELVINENLFHSNSIRDIENMTIENIEKEHILKVLQSTAYRIRGEKGAAKILGLKPTTLEARMKKLGISKNNL